MSKTCRDCGEPLDVDRDAINGLSIGCNCKRQSVKVASKLPERWEHE